MAAPEIRNLSSSVEIYFTSECSERLKISYLVKISYLHM